MINLTRGLNQSRLRLLAFFLSDVAGHVGRPSEHLLYSSSRRSKSAASLRLETVALNVFKFWRQKNVVGDTRAIEDIPPEELDEYLSQFFRTATRRDGSHYSSSSLFSLRSGLESYLSSKHYSGSIISGRVFPKSQLAFKARRIELDSLKKHCETESSVPSPDI